MNIFRFREIERVREFQVEEEKTNWPNLFKFAMETGMPFLEKEGFVVDANGSDVDIFDETFFETKSEEWLVLNHRNTKSLIRKYHKHLVVYSFVEKEDKEDHDVDSFHIYMISCDQGDVDGYEEYEKVNSLLYESLDYLAKKGRILHSEDINHALSRNLSFLSDLNIWNVSDYLFVAAELSLFSMYVSMAKIDELASLNESVKFKIPYSQGGFLTGFDSSKGVMKFKILDKKGNEETIDLFNIMHYGDDLMNVFNFFEWRDN